MKERLRHWPVKCLAALPPLLGLAPVFVLMGRWLFPDGMLLWWLPPVLCFGWAAAGYLLPPKGRVPWTAAGCAGLAAWSALQLLPPGVSCLLLALPCLALLLLLPPAWGRTLWEEWPVGLWLGGIVTHLIGQFLATRPPFSGTKPLLTGFFLGYAFLFLLYMNRIGIRDGMHGAEKAPAALRNRNTLLVIVFFLAGTAVAFWRTLGEWVNRLTLRLLMLIGAVIDWFMRLLPVNRLEGGGGAGGGDMLAGLSDEAAPSPFALFMEKVFSVLAALLLAVLLFFALRTLGRRLAALWKLLAARLRRFAADAREDYVDEAESTLNWEERAQSLRNRMRRAAQRTPRQPRWETLDGRARVRRLYRQYIQKRPETRGLTARENLRQDKRLSPATARAFTDLYEQARYSSHEVSAQAADALRKEL